MPENVSEKKTYYENPDDPCDVISFVRLEWAASPEVDIAVHE